MNAEAKKSQPTEVDATVLIYCGKTSPLEVSRLLGLEPTKLLAQSGASHGRGKGVAAFDARNWHPMTLARRSHSSDGTSPTGSTPSGCSSSVRSWTRAIAVSAESQDAPR